jgi:hypothetical protein
MSLLEKYITGALVLIGIFLLVDKASGANTIIDAFGRFNTGAIKALQGRS